MIETDKKNHVLQKPYKEFRKQKDKLISVFSKIPAIVIKVSAKKMTRNHGNSGTFGE